MAGSFLRRHAARLLADRQAQKEADKPADGEPAEEQAAPQGGSPKAWRGLVEQRIQEGIENGAFDNLAGAGKPQNLEEDAMVPEDMRMAFRLLRSNGLAPLWVQINREIRDDMERLERYRTFAAGRWHTFNEIKQDHHRREYAARVRDINSRILNYNITAPSLLVHFPMLILEEELAKFDQAVANVR